MHTVVVIIGVVVNIITALSILSIIIGLIWMVYPPKDKMYFGSVSVYEYYYPLGGRGTGFIILLFGAAGLILGFLLDDWHVNMMRKYGART